MCLFLFKFCFTLPKLTRLLNKPKRCPNQQANSVSFIYLLDFIILILGRGQKPYAIKWLRWYQTEYTFTARDSASGLVNSRYLQSVKFLRAFRAGIFLFIASFVTSSVKQSRSCSEDVKKCDKFPGTPTRGFNQYHKCFLYLSR